MPDGTAVKRRAAGSCGPCPSWPGSWLSSARSGGIVSAPRTSRRPTENLYAFETFLIRSPHPMDVRAGACAGMEGICIPAGSIHLQLPRRSEDYRDDVHVPVRSPAARAGLQRRALAESQYSVTVVDYSNITQLGLEKQKACPAGSEACRGGSGAPGNSTGPGYSKADKAGAITYATWLFLQRDAR